MSERYHFMQRILVTGGAGFIGSHTVDLLLANNQQVVVFDNLVSGDLTYLDLTHPHLKFVSGDILDFPLLLAEIKNCDAVLHLAALPSVIKSIENPIASLQVNLQGFLHILQAVRQLDKPIRVIYASSAAVYGNNTQLPCNDKQSLSSGALSPYALEKANNERYAELYAQLFGIRTLGLRYFNVYGVRQNPHSPYAGVISKFIEQYKKARPLTVFGDGEQARDFIYIADVARANCLALQSNYSGILNIGTGIPETLLNLINYIGEAAGEMPEVTFTPSRVGEIQSSYAATDKAQDCLGFRAEMSLKQGIHSLLKIGYD